MGMILCIAPSHIVGYGDIVDRSGGFKFKLSANSVMRGRVNAIRTFKSLVADLRFIFLSIKLLCRFKDQGYAFFFTISLSAYPMLTKFLFRIVYKSFAWVCHINGAVSYTHLRAHETTE